MNRFEKISIEQWQKDYKLPIIISHISDVHNSEVLNHIDEIENGIYESIAVPKRQTAHSAGYDFCSPGMLRIDPNETARVCTGIKARLDPDCVLLLDVRSSVGIKRWLSLANTIGIVDADYYNNPDNEGHIILFIRNNSSEPQSIEAGERIAQGVIVRYVTTDDDKAAGSREGGFGSTGK